MRWVAGSRLGTSRRQGCPGISVPPADDFCAADSGLDTNQCVSNVHAPPRFLLSLLPASVRRTPSRRPMAPVTHAEDLRLVQSVVAGDREAGDRLAERLQCIGRFLRTRGRHLLRQATEDDLLDIGADVFQRLWGRLASYGGRASIESWVFAFCEGELRNALRRHVRRKVVPQDIPEELLATGSDRTEPDHTPLLRCLDRLPAEERQLVRDKHYGDESIDEIARRLAANVNTVKSRYCRALVRLRHCLENTGHA